MMQAHQIIFFNGPPKSGKDLAARFATNEFPSARHYKMAGPLKAAVAAMFSIFADTVKWLEEEHHNDRKDVLMPALFGMSWRQALIWYSEDVMKPKFGKDVFGRIAVNALQRPTPGKFTIISDSGFEDEAIPIIEAFGVTNCHVFRLHRTGCTFEGDSRGYIFEGDNKPKGLHTEDLHNVHEKFMYRIQILSRLNKILGVDRPLG